MRSVRPALRLLRQSSWTFVLGGLLGGCLLAQSEAQLARQALERGAYKRAEALYRSLLHSAPSSPELLNNLGVALHYQGKSSEAIQVFEKALRLKEMPASLALLGLNYCKLHDNDRAARILRRAKRYFADTSILTILGPCYLDLGEPLDAVLVYQELLNRRGSPADENLAYFAKACLRASKHFLALLEKAPRNQDYVHAIEQARQNSSPDANAARGLALKTRPYLRPGMSIQEMALLLPQHGDDAALLYMLGVVSGEQAMQAFLLCEKQYPDSIAVRTLRAEMLASQGRYDEAVAAYRLLADLPHPPPGIHHDLAMLYRKTGEWDEALREFQQQQRAQPDDERSAVGISECLLRLGRFVELKQHLKPIAAGPSPPEWALLDLSSAEQELGNLDGATRCLQLAARQDPTSQTVHYRLSRLYSLAGRHELAAQEARTFQKLKQSRAEDGSK